jgi:succinate dehydrogenase / fumarate reductase, cytochrome b subunit
MSQLSQVFKASLGHKLVMALTGIFLILFLLFHLTINLLVFAQDGGLTFNTAAQFLGHNIIPRILEWGLMLGFAGHIYQAIILTRQNQKSRPEAYAYTNPEKSSPWYSRSMGILGTLILVFLIVHFGNFWVKTRFIGLSEALDVNGHDNLSLLMFTTFQNWWIVVLYDLAMISLAYHLLHGFSSAFQTLGIQHKTYTPIINAIGLGFSLLVPFLFASIPTAIFFHLIK